MPNCNQCVKTIECVWRRGVLSALHDLAYTGRYTKAADIGNAVHAWLPKACRGFVLDVTQRDGTGDRNEKGEQDAN